ncbi:unnamed protein product [Echinostoma caproni]|uniref:GST C-terminal domain-containing protein n=1 Tax=Echinostoma caproni TaxID=27848 RepID=A0A3P8GDD4_9TREM|nr:unnamed protein product [Echinostoma caproni]
MAQSLFKLVTSSLEAGGGKHVTGNRITLADLVLFTTLDQVEEVMPGYLGKHYPKLHEFHTSLPNACPRLASYLKSRPKLPF